MTALDALLEHRPVLLADGGTGTGLFDMGLMSGDAPELWNIDNPDTVTTLHQGFVDAGSDIILTNSFGGTRHRLKLHNAQDRVFALNKAAGELARSIADAADRPIVVAGSIGPTGELLEPLGALTYEDSIDAFAEQAEGLKAGGVDVLWIETMSAADEIKAAIEAAGRVGLDYIYTASFDTAGRTMMGLMPHALGAVAHDCHTHPKGYGANCGVGASDLLVSILAMTEADPDALVVAKANCGIPVFRGDTVEYSGTPELMADYARLAIDAGARIIGGCCGTSTDHLRAMRAAIDSHTPGPRPTLESIIATIGPLTNPAPAANDSAPRRERTGRRRRAAA